MGRRRGFRPGLHRLDLSDGDFLTIKSELTAGEYREIFTGMLRDRVAGQPATVNAKRTGLTRVLAYLIGWSFVDQDDRPIPYGLEMTDEAREHTLLNLDVDSWQEVLAAIDKYAEDAETARDLRKNAQDGGPGSSATSPSVAG